MKFLGFVPDAELKQVHEAADVFVLPSLWEVLPIAVLEALACGKPVVCTDAGGNRELVKDGVNGLVVPKRNPAQLAYSINRLLDDPALRERMGKAGLRHARAHFNWPSIARKTIAVYRRVIEEKKREVREPPLHLQQMQVRLLALSKRMRSLSSGRTAVSARTLFKRARQSIRTFDLRTNMHRLHGFSMFSLLREKRKQK